ncbi:PotD/PotF family extracellular solute-binding protein [uncultured Finegoldia sp.]|uniref:ABC transporter substrate-binding protein n=1 Tax=uncultured Finegoldia sp. TaxID=328009 RepID=UPI00261A66F3|nr:spermidine/putrescine ABC transporter substrate-binding protein [uncultured Finegoldia sp.]
MKKILLFLLTIFLLTSCSKEESNILYVYNWGEYIEPTLIDKFEKETGIKVVYDMFEQNEDMFMKVKEGGSNYDVVVPSDYMAQKMIKLGMLEKLNYKNIPNFKYIDKEFRNLDYDPQNEYTVPYMWGTVGIVYNKNQVKEKVDSWNILWNEKYKDNIIMMNSTRDTLGVALKRLGYSMNTRDEKQLETAKKSLIKQKPLVLAYLVDETKSQMANGEADIALMYSGDAIIAKAENKNLEYVIPKEGSNLWVDTMAILKGAKHKENAEKFINFMTKPENAKLNAEYIGYSLPSTAAKKLLDQQTQQDKTAYPDLSKHKNMEIFRDPSDFIEKYDDIWADIKAN